MDLNANDFLPAEDLALLAILRPLLAHGLGTAKLLRVLDGDCETCQILRFEKVELYNIIERAQDVLEAWARGHPMSSWDL